jgi:hypothetical protein
VGLCSGCFIYESVIRLFLCNQLQVLQRQMPFLGGSMVVGSLWAFAVVASSTVMCCAIICFCGLPAVQVLQQQMPRLGDSMVVGSLWAFAVAAFIAGDVLHNRPVRACLVISLISFVVCLLCNHMQVLQRQVHRLGDSMVVGINRPVRASHINRLFCGLPAVQLAQPTAGAAAADAPPG